MHELEERLLKVEAEASASRSEAASGTAAGSSNDSDSISVSETSPSAHPAQPGEDQGGFVTVQSKHKVKRKRIEHQPPNVQNREPEPDTLLIGSSIVRDVKLPAVSVRCYPGARVGDIEGNLRLLKQGGRRFRRVVIHAGGNDARRRQSEVLKLQVAAVCELAKSMSDTVIFSGPLPNLTSDEMYSRHLSFNSWLARWCKENSVSYVRNYEAFLTRPWLMRRDGIHPTLEGASLLAQNLADRLNHLN